MKKFEKLLKQTADEGTQEWEISAEPGRGGTGVIKTVYGRKDGKKIEISEVIKEGKNLGKKNETSPYEQACAEAEARWNKQKDRKGYGLTAEESADVRSVSPMLAHTYDKHAKKVDWGTAFAQPKLDGFRCLAHISNDRKVKLLSRENQPLLALADLRGTIEEIASGLTVFTKLDDGLILDGELYCHGMSLNQISSACKKKSDLTKKIQYHVYDAVMGEADFKTRSLFVGDFVKAAGSDLLVPVETVKVRSEADLMHSQKHFMDEGFEGAMLRYGHSPYEAGRRSAKLLKVKTFLDGEFKVVDFKMGRGKMQDCPVFTCETADGDSFDVTAPGTMEEKKALGVVAKTKVGKMLTVKYIYFTKTENPVPFLPVAIRFRD